MTEHQAFGSRIVFNMTYETTGSLKRTRTLFRDLKAAVGKMEEQEELDAADVIVSACHTTGMTIHETHPAFANAFEIWQLFQSPTVDLARLAGLLQDVSRDVLKEWSAGYNAAQLPTTLLAPRPLLPDEHLTEAERADPNGKPGESKAATTSGQNSKPKRQPNTTESALTANPTTGG